MSTFTSTLKTVGWGLVVASAIIAPNPVSIGAAIAFAPDGVKGAADIFTKASDAIDEKKESNKNKVK